jgi:hypothetical protein
MLKIALAAGVLTFAGWGVALAQTAPAPTPVPMATSPSVPTVPISLPPTGPLATSMP